MSNAEFKIAMRNLVILKKSYEGNRWNRPVGRPQSEHLSNTPLTQAIVATAEIMKKFKSSNNLDMTSLVIVHDGDSDWTNYYNTMVETNDGSMVPSSRSIDPRYTNVVIRDVEHKFETKLIDNSSRDDIMSVSLEWFRKTTGAKVFGFFLIPDSGARWMRGTVSHRYVLSDGTTMGDKIFAARQRAETYHHATMMEEEVKEIVKKFKQEKFLISNTKGFNSFYLVMGGDDLKTEDDEIEIEGKVTSTKLTKAFMKMNKKKQISRVLVSKFIQGIAA
jgi:hypothetical protein